MLCSLTLPAALLLRQNHIISLHNSGNAASVVFTAQSSSRISAVLSKHHKSVQLSGINKTKPCDKSLPVCLTGFNRFRLESQDNIAVRKMVASSCLGGDDKSEHLPKNLMHSTTHWLKCRLHKCRLYLKRKSKISDSTMNLTPENKIKKTGNDGFMCQLQTIFSSVYFFLILGSHLSYFWGVITFTMVVADLVADNGIGSSASPMITAFALGDLIGRVSSGKHFVNKKSFLKTLHSLSIHFV